MPILLALPALILILAFQNFSYLDYKSNSVPALAQERPILTIQKPAPGQMPQTYELNPPKRLFFSDSNALEFQWQGTAKSRLGNEKLQLFIENIESKSIYPIEVALNRSPMTLEFSDIKNQLNVIQHLDKSAQISSEPKDYRLKMLMFDSSQIQFIRIQRTLHF